jgi:hypothetical protein
MPHTPYTRQRSTCFPSSVTEVQWEPQRDPARRGNRITLGFGLGGILLGTAGCIFGASLSSHHPVAWVLSVLWWGIYCGCLGASLGALPGLFLERSSAGWARTGKAAGKPSIEADNDGQACPQQTADYPVNC